MVCALRDFGSAAILTIAIADSSSDLDSVHLTHIEVRSTADRPPLIFGPTDAMETLIRPMDLIIDASHANSRKKHERQRYVCRDICAQVSGGDDRIMGVMVESNLIEGIQNLGGELVRGQSVTGACIDWDETVAILAELSTAVAARRSC